MTEQDLLEQHIDRHGMAHLLTMLANICHEKADHVEVNYWPSRAAASAWRRGAKRLEEAAAYADWPL